MAPATTLPELAKELKELKESIDLYENIVYTSGTDKKQKSDKLKETPSLATPKSSVQAIIDVAALSKAHTTKVGIAFKLPISVGAASKTLADSSALIPAIVGAFVAINDDKQKAEKVGILLLDEVKNQVLDFLSAHKGLCTELISLSEHPEKDADKNSEESGRLVSVGRVWKACDQVMAISQLRSSKILAIKVEQFAEMLQDALDDLEDFIENGNEGGNDDFILEFGSDEEDDQIFEKLQNAKSKRATKEEDEDEGEDGDDEPTELQLLAQGFKTSIDGLPSFYRDVVIPQASKNPADVILHYKLYTALSSLSTNIDDLVGEFLNEEAEDDDVKISITDLKKQLKQLTDLVGSAPLKDSKLDDLTKGLVEKLNLD